MNDKFYFYLLFDKKQKAQECKSIYRFNLFLLTAFITSIGFSQHAFTEERSKQINPSFHFLVWPQIGSLFQNPSETDFENGLLQSAWLDNHLPSYLGRPLNVLSQNTDSLKIYFQTIRYSQPECFEGNPGLIENEINGEDRRYLPILQCLADRTDSKMLLRGEIVFTKKGDAWRGRMGVVHPSFDVGGAFQIEYWENETGNRPDVVTLYSPNEVLRHLIVGDINAAAVPVGALDLFLKEHGRDDLQDRFIRVRMPESGSSTVIFLRNDLYADPLVRTLVTETWLRNGMTNRVRSAPVCYYK